MSIKTEFYAIASAALIFAVMLGACSDGASNVPSEGTADNPVRIGDSPFTYSGTVALAGDSYFVASGEAGKWTVAISNIDGKPDLFVYSDPEYSSFVCQSVNPDVEPDSCTIECLTACDIYIRVSGAADSGASFNLSIVRETSTLTAREFLRLVTRRETR